ncbi:MAG: OmpA family protein [Candidatus Acidiferrales bacterium]
MKTLILVGLLLVTPFALTAQAPEGAALPRASESITVSGPPGAIISFRPRGTTTVELRGTEHIPRAFISLKVQNRRGFVEIDINRGAIKGLEPPWTFGPDFLTYVLWVVSVDGAASNIGEITFERGQPISINVTTPYQTFWMMVTAEPDFAVHDPSPVVVLVSQSQADVSTGNKGFPIPGRLIYHTNYTQYKIGELAEEPTGAPIHLLQARKAIEFASQSGILATPTSRDTESLPEEERTRETLEVARSYLAQAELEFRRSGRNDQTIQFARAATQIAENARALALGAVGGLTVLQLERELDKLEADVGPLRRAADEARLALARSQRELASLREQLTEIDSLGDQLAQLEAALDRERGLTRELESQLLALREQISLLEGQLGTAGQEAAGLRSDRDAICAELNKQLSSLGQLTETGGDLMLNLASDILFDFNRYDLRPAARETLAKLAVLRLMLFSRAAVRYEGHTDLAGEEDYNQWLSEQRALAVYRYFLQDRLSYAAQASDRADAQEKLRSVEALLNMNFNAARRAPDRRQELLDRLGDAVTGRGMREPLIPVQGANEENRRVTLIFPEAQAGQLSSLCAAATR